MKSVLVGQGDDTQIKELAYTYDLDVSSFTCLTEDLDGIGG